MKDELDIDKCFDYASLKAENLVSSLAIAVILYELLR